MQQIKGSLVLITGASSGIGMATARVVAAEGGRVLLVARTHEKLKSLAEEINTKGSYVKIYPTDLTDAEAVQKMATTIKEQEGVPDVIINSAGMGRWLFTEETFISENVAMMAVPYFAAFNVVKMFMEDMLQRKSGCIVNITSPASFVPWPGATSYTAARWAMRGFTEALQTDLHGTGVNVILVVPGKTKTEYFEHNRGTEERIPKLAKLIPTMSPEYLAYKITQGIKKNRKKIIVPFVLKIFLTFNKLCPRLVKWLTIVTGWKRKNRTPACPSWL